MPRDEVDDERGAGGHPTHEPGRVPREHARRGGARLLSSDRHIAHSGSSFPRPAQPITNWCASTSEAPSRTVTPWMRPLLYSEPELMQSVRPTRVSPRDSWMWPCSATIGWYSSMIWRTAVLPTGIGFGCPLRYTSVSSGV